MKKIVFTLVLISTFCMLVSAQGDFRIGFNVSPNITWMGTDVTYINTNGTNLGLDVGIIGEYYFAERYAVTAGLGFAFNQGGKLQYDNRGNYWTNTEFENTDLNSDEADLLPSGTNLRYGIQYVEIPLGLKLLTSEFGYVRFFADAPILTIGIRAKTNGDISMTNVPEYDVVDQNIKEEIAGIALSWGLGAGVEYSVGANTSLVAGLYFNQLFTDTTKDNGTYVNAASEVKTEDSKTFINGITLRLGVMF